MFRPRPEGDAATIAVIVEGRTIFVPAGASAVAAVLVAGLRSAARPRSTAASEPYCMMGICFDCLAEIDGIRTGTAAWSRPSRECGSAVKFARVGSIRRRDERRAVIVGGGEAGMAAAGLAAELGLETMLIDEQALPAARSTRIERPRPDSPLGPDYLSGRPLAAGAAPAGWYRPDTALAYRPRWDAVPRERRRTEMLTARASCSRPAPSSGRSRSRVDIARGHGSERRADPAEVRRSRPRRPHRAGGTGTAPLSARGAAARRSAADRSSRNDAIGELSRCRAAPREPLARPPHADQRIAADISRHARWHSDQTRRARAAGCRAATHRAGRLGRRRARR